MSLFKPTIAVGGLSLANIESILARLEKRVAALEDATRMFADFDTKHSIYRIAPMDEVRISTVVALLVQHLGLEIVSIRPTGQSVKLTPKEGVDKA